MTVPPKKDEGTSHGAKKNKHGFNILSPPQFYMTFGIIVQAQKRGMFAFAMNTHHYLVVMLCFSVLLLFFIHKHASFAF